MGMSSLNLGFGLAESNMLGGKAGWISENMNGIATTGAAVGIVSQGVGQIASAWNSFSTASANAGMQHASAYLTRENAKLHLDDAAESVRMAGETQKSALDATTNRYLQLGQDIGRIYSSTAGSGIDVSSATARHVDKSARLMANRDVTAINHTAAEQGRAYVRQAQAQRLAYVNDLANAAMMDIQADYQKKIAASNARSATWGAIENMAIGGTVLALV